jgi:histidine ammonia-lyase
VRPAADAAGGPGLAPLVLEAKEGLALVNGTQAMASLLALPLVDAGRLVTCADVAAAMTVEALKGSHRPFDEAVTRLRPAPRRDRGRRQPAGPAARLRDRRLPCGLRQGAGRLLAAHGAAGAWRGARRAAYVRAVLEVELASVTDNPLLIVDEGRAVSAGNFHGEPLALAADHAKVAVAELANISERRIEQMLNPRSPACRPSWRSTAASTRA